MQVVLAGSLAFEILDRITGEWSVVHTSWVRPVDLSHAWCVLTVCSYDKVRETTKTLSKT
jgi:WD repeat-containing protein 35